MALRTQRRPVPDLIVENGPPFVSRFDSGSPPNHHVRKKLRGPETLRPIVELSLPGGRPSSVSFGAGLHQPVPEVTAALHVAQTQKRPACGWSLRCR